MPGPDEDNEFFVFPHVAPGIPNNLCQNCVGRTNQNNDTDMSLTIANVRLPYTGTYVCHMSVRVNSKKKPVSGNGTYLLVHEPLDTSINVTTNSILCRSEVQEVKDVFLIWDYDGGRIENPTYPQALKSSYEISTELHIGKIECRGRENVTAVCLLQYMGNTLTNRSIEFPCPGSYAGGGMTSQPVLLYVLLLVSSLLILLIVTLVFCVRKRRRRREESDLVYTNIENNK
ncbi:uncharacterized protein LOC120915967 [Rana temporaria]|uniref:uncharacterized protein LOC120915967 n=1 Tax=Rana temporaria TaxID=8407 RepID=UPI001AAC67D5|nr:uncharacterized protein LOC120915967 [Rana temporaria]